MGAKRRLDDLRVDVLVYLDGDHIASKRIKDAKNEQELVAARDQKRKSDIILRSALYGYFVESERMFGRKVEEK